MMNFKQPGRTITVAAPYNVSSGGGVLVSGTGHIFGIAAVTVLSGASVEIDVEGVFLMAKDTSTFAEADFVYWDNTAKLATSTSTSNTKIGIAVIANPNGANDPGGNSGDATVTVRLNPAFGTL